MTGPLMAWNEEPRSLDKTVADRALTVDGPWRPTTRAVIGSIPTLTAAATLDAFRDTDDGEFVIMAVVDSSDEPSSWEPVLMTVTAPSADDAKEAVELWGEVTRFDVVIALVRALTHAGLPLAREGTGPTVVVPVPGSYMVVTTPPNGPLVDDPDQHAGLRVLLDEDPMEDEVRVVYDSEAYHRTSRARQARRSRARERLRKDIITPLEAVMTTRIAKSGDEIETVSTKTHRINRPQQKTDKEH